MPGWSHSPAHFLDSSGAYIVTAATYRKNPIFQSRRHLDFLLRHFQSLADKYGIRTQAWALFPNHYHFVALLDDSSLLATFVRHFHSVTAAEVNRLDRTPGRKVWFQYWESHLTFEKSYFARLHYVHENPVHHHIARVASNYPWCSAGWFQRKASAAFQRMVFSFPCDRIAIPDAFAVEPSQFATP
ncbi:MAG TPA: transposase [Candidatus Acidoferrales bacterium]|nr:transposase [Candidatus Acidoferrales bacterium]